MWSDIDVAEGYLHELYEHDYEYEDAMEHHAMRSARRSKTAIRRQASGPTVPTADRVILTLGAKISNSPRSPRLLQPKTTDTSLAMLVPTGCRTTPLLCSLGTGGTRDTVRASRRRQGEVVHWQIPGALSQRPPETSRGAEDEEHMSNSRRESPLGR